MSRQTLSIPPLLAFAAPASELWGVAPAGSDAQLLLGGMDEPLDGATAARLESDPGSDIWTLSSGEVQLSVTAEPPGVAVAEPDPGLALVRVSGSLLGAEAAGGLRHPGWPELQADSVRLLCAWFPGERAIALLAVRPSRAKGQDRDQVSAICIGEPEEMTGFDPRLSSTYGENGLLRRVGVELWLGENEEADMYSLRVAGEARSAAAVLELDGLTLQAQPLRCHSRGEAGVGVYLLIRSS